MRGAADPDARVVLAILSLSVLGMTATSPSARKAFFVPIAALSICLVFFTASDNLPNDYFQGCATMINLFRMSDFLLLTDVHKEIRKKGEIRDVSTLPFLSRLWRSLSLYASLRGVGWDHEPTSHLPAPPKRSKTVFILRQSLVLAQSYLIFNFGNLLVLLNSSFSEGGPPFSSQKWWIRPTAIGQTLQVNGFLQGLYTLCSIIGVVANLSTPYDWPPLFGSFTDAYTVRNYWGRVWHQFLTAHGTFFANVLGIPKGRFRSYFSLYVAFFISGLIHYFGDYKIIQNWSGGSLIYFTLQAVAITFEDGVVGLVRRSGVKVPPVLAKLVGYLWVVAWFSFAIPIWMEPHVKAGITSNDVSDNAVIPALAQEIAARLRLEVR
ncbi:hypothetical protein EST38_g6808 [Candolleomyces aberdarensis]|uniref:Wax synthase domain-containing protein n=1 Tax=Candolleomyces aberdarensis TaxID=2316362 RepID=A0A4Q2DH78_9AGAR|nr:hypothetical protein EST38_g6808 [Candolleomyces aberdarensis]